MEISTLVNRWINSGCDYEQGVKLYEQFGSSKTLKSLFSKFRSRYYNDKLYQELLQIKIRFEAENTIVPVEIKAPRTPFEELPAQLQKLERQKSELFMQILKNRKLLKKFIKLNTKGQITMAEALEQMAEKDRNGRYKPFSISYISYSKRTGKGGQIVSFSSCFLRVLNNTGSKTIKNEKRISMKQPNHWKNSTRNIEPIGSGEIRKFHIWLMIEFNGKEVVISDLG